jgi:hypothetical protein
MDYIYELIDETDEEMHLPLGLWLSLEDALRAFAGFNHPRDFHDHEDDEGFSRFVLYRRPMGMGWTWDSCMVWSIEFTERYDADLDLYFWDRRDWN